MTKKLAVVFVVLFVLIFAFITGCSSNEADTVVAPQQTTDTPSAPEPAVEAPVVEVSTEPTVSEQASAEKKLSTGDKVVLGTPYKIMKVGETYVFVLGIHNVMPKDTKFKLDVKFSNAMTSGGLATPIPGVDDTIYTWLSKSKFKTMTLGNDEKKFVPIVLSVGPSISGSQNTIEGSYVFDVKVEFEKTAQFWDDYGVEQLTIKVRE